MGWTSLSHLRSAWPAGGPTVFATFESDTDYFGSPAQQTMLNFRVRGGQSG